MTNKSGTTYSRRRKSSFAIFLIVFGLGLIIAECVFLTSRIKEVRKSSRNNDSDAANMKTEKRTSETLTYKPKKHVKANPTSQQEHTTDEERLLPFDISTKKIDLHYSGVDLSRLYDHLDHFWDITQDKDESDISFNVRKQYFYDSSYNRTVLDDVKFQSCLAFNTFSEQSDELNRAHIISGYDESNQTLIVTLKPIRISNDIVDNRTETTVCLSKELNGMEGKYYGIRIDIGDVTRQVNELTAKIPGVNSSYAAQLINSVEALVVFYNDYREYDEDDRVSTCVKEGIWNNVYANYAKDVEVWFYDGSTGRILGKFPFHSLCKDSDSNSWNISSLDFGFEVEEGKNALRDKFGFSLTPIYEDATFIEKDYRGHSTEDILLGIANKCPILEKGEFETSREFKKRETESLKAFPNARLYGEMDFKSRFAFLVNPSIEIGSTTYNADHSRMEISFDSLNFWENDNSDPNSRVFIKIQGWNVDWGDFLVTDVVYDPNDSLNLTVNILEVPREKAIDFKDEISAVMVYSLSEKVFHRKFNSGPLPIQNVEFWFYYNKTGEIIAKYTLKEALISKKKRLGDLRTPLNRGGALRALARGGDVDREPLPTWEQLYSERGDFAQNWDSVKVTRRLSGDAISFEDAVSNASRGDVLLIEGTVPLRRSITSNSVVSINKPLTILGDSKATIEIGLHETLEIKGVDIRFKNIAFKNYIKRNDLASQPIISVVGTGAATFKSCELDGDRLSSSSGVSAVGSGSRAEFWDCVFTRFESRAAQATEGASIVLKYCQFDDCKSECAYAFDEGSVEAIRTRFANSGSGYVANAGGSGKLEECRFENNRADWEITSTSRKKVEIVDCASDKDAEK